MNDPHAGVESMPGDLTCRDDVEVLVRCFYVRAFADPMLGPIFRDVAHMDLDAHLPVMCDFWETVPFRRVCTGATLCRTWATSVIRR